MKIIEALKEIPLIQKKIDSKILDIQKYSSISSNNDPDYKDQAAHVESLFQSVKDLSKRRAYLSMQLAVTNAATKVEIDGETCSITEWISMKNGGLKNIIQALTSMSTSNAQSVLRTQQVNLEEGVKIIKFFDPEKRDSLISRNNEILSKIDGVLEVINATTDLIE